MSEGIIQDPTDTGTLRPHARPLERSGNHFHPMDLPDFDYCITLPPSVDANSPISIFRLYYSPKMIDQIVFYTNSYRREPSNTSKQRARALQWKPTSASEIYIYLAIRIYMTLYVLNQVSDYWNTSSTTPFHPFVKYMSRDRFLELHMRFRLTPTQPTSSLWSRVEPLSQHIQDVNLQLWKPGRDLAVDELIIRFTGRAYEIVTIPSKPTPTGFKAWAIAQRGFLLRWVFHEPGKNKGPVGVRVPQELGGNPKGNGGNKTQAVVPHLLELLPKASYHVYIDNLFTSTKLIELLRSKGFGATGTCRTNSGVIQELVDLKNQDKGKAEMAWGTTKTIATESELVNQVGWKDNAFVLTMSSVHSGVDLISRLRKRPRLSSSKSKTARAPFGCQSTKELDIPVLFDEYNHQMGAVDVANQLAAVNPGRRRIRRGGWQAIEQWLLVTALVNSYLVSFHSNRLNRTYYGAQFRSQAPFRNQLIEALLKLGENAPVSRIDATLGPNLGGIGTPNTQPSNDQKTNKKGLYCV